MLSAIGGGETGAVYFRPVERATPVGSRAADPRSEPAVTDETGRPLREVAPSLESLSIDKRLLLAELRGELAAREQDLRQFDARQAGEGAGPGEASEQEEATEGARALAEPIGSRRDEAEDPTGLTEAEEAQVEELKARDREVRAHEQAHAAVGGAFAGAPTYTYQIGPDGQRYAVGGEVRIDVSPIPGDPEATLEKMRVVERAALAPAEPSPQDRKVAQAARAAAQQASAEAAAQSAAERRGEAEAGYAAGAAATAAQAETPVFSLAA